MKRLLPLLLTLLLALTPIARAETMTFSDMTIPAFLVSVEVFLATLWGYWGK